MSASAWGAVAAVIVGVVFLVAAVTKLANQEGWRSQAAALGVPGVVAVVVPYTEAVLGALLVVQLGRHLVAWLAAALLLAMTMLLVARLAQGERPPCACFGALSAKPISAALVVRNLVLAALAVAAAAL
jgi:uncharacterized membrane protein YphA (DoxX/SURF4 family)